ncbi:MAG TPA: VWA domain-containing protein [Dehalococcoidia bacterium]|nr:VWA domain-containing protein [Dehalococcoidia bacterium]
MILKPAALLAAIVTLTFSGLVFAADPVNIEIMAVEEEPGRMVLTVSAVDENGKPFPGLDPSSFNAWINDQALIVKELHTAVDREPASVLMLIDVSGSMAGEPIEQAQVAINEFIDVLEPTDEVGVMAFSTGVTLIQDFTSDRDALDAAIANLTLTNDTALYDGVIEAASKMAGVDRSRKLIVLLSDGLANINQGARDSSIEAARNAGVGFIAVSLGANTDRDYLVALADASGGSLIEAASPAELRQAYTSLAFAIRSQYTLVTEVPRSIDRTIAGTLKVHVIHRADNAFAERALGPLEGAFPPPFTMSLSGINPGDKHNGAVELAPTVEEGIEVTKIDYILDDEVVHTTQGVGSYTLDASLLENGGHVIKVVATDIQGREGEVQVPFIVPVLVAPSEGTSLPIIPILILVVLLGGAYFAYKFGRKRWLEITTPTYSRVDNWASIRKPNVGPKAEASSDNDQSAHPLSRPPASDAEPPDEAVQGRVVIMDEAAVRGGELETIREFEMKSLPLTFGSGPDADMRVGDAGGLIAAEEARIWVQRGRLVYHKLTTLSAMATEGVTAGWQFLDDGDEMRIGPYRIIFQTQQPEQADVDVEPLPDGLPQEHGMALHRSFGLTETDRSPDLKEWADGEGPSPPRERPAAPASSVGESDAPQAIDDPSAPLPTWESSLQSGADEAAEEFITAESSWDVAPDEPQPSEWEIVDNTSPADGAWALEANGSPQPAVDGSGPDELAADGDGDSSSQPAEWGPTLLEPKSADWLVEQSEPVDDGVGQILQPDAWGGFVSGDDDGSATSETDSLGNDEGDPEERAWGT